MKPGGLDAPDYTALARELAEARQEIADLKAAISAASFALRKAGT